VFFETLEVANDHHRRVRAEIASQEAGMHERATVAKCVGQVLDAAFNHVGRKVVSLQEIEREYQIELPGIGRKISTSAKRKGPLSSSFSTSGCTHIEDANAAQRQLNR
jgi:hypothetical protein